MHGGATGGTATGECMRVDSLLAVQTHNTASFMCFLTSLYMLEFLSHTHTDAHHATRDTPGWRCHVEMLALSIS